MAVDLREQLQSSLGDAYRIEQELGGGGMSRVFVAVETALDRRVVVKVLLPELAAGVSSDRFRREIYLAAQLQHPHIVPLLAAGDADGLPWFTMPYVSGESLRARLMRDGELPVAESIRILRDVASALAYAHQQGVVHRDIKPDNVLLSHGVAVVTDFGVAKALTVSTAEAAIIRGGPAGLTSMGVSLGTPAYMAPEQASADPGMDHRVDVYAFGVTAYEMLTGQPPFAGRSPQAILGAHVAVLPEPVSSRRPGLPPLLVAMVMKCLEKRAADRPQTAGELIQMLDMMTTPSGFETPVPAPTVVVRPAASAHARALRRWGATVAALLVLAGVAWWALSPAPQPEQRGPAPAAVAPPAPRPRPPPADTVALPEPPPAARPARPVSPERSEPDPSAAPRERARTALAAEEAALLRRLRDEAGSARGRALAAGAPAEVLARGDSSVAAAESLAGEGRIAQAAARLSSAAALWTGAAERPAPPPVAAADTVPAEAPAPVPPPAPVAAPVPADPTREIGAVVAAYSAAIESRSVPAIRRVYPGLRDAQAREWEQFFEAVAAIDVDLRIASLKVSGETAQAALAGVYVFDDPSSHRERRESVSVTARLRRDAGAWRIEEIR